MTDTGLLGSILPPDGVQIVPCHNWPRVFVGYEMKQVRAHPLVCWLAKYLPIRPYVECRVEVFRDSEMALNSQMRVLLCSHAQYQAIIRGCSDRVGL